MPSTKNPTSVKLDEITFSVIVDPENAQGKNDVLPLKDVEVKDGYALISADAIHNALFSFHLESRTYKDPLFLLIIKGDKKVDERWINFGQQAVEDEQTLEGIDIKHRRMDEWSRGKGVRKEVPLKFGRKSVYTKPETYDIILYKATDMENTTPTETVNKKITGKRKNRPDEPSPLFREEWKTCEFDWAYAQRGAQKRFGSRKRPARKESNTVESNNGSTDEDLYSNLERTQSWESPMAVFRLTLDYPQDGEEPSSVPTRPPRARLSNSKPADTELRSKRRRVDESPFATANGQDSNEERNSQVDSNDSDGSDHGNLLIPYKDNATSKNDKSDSQGDDDDVDMTDDDKENNQSQRSTANMRNNGKRGSIDEGDLEGTTLLNNEDEYTTSRMSASSRKPNRITKSPRSKGTPCLRGPARLRKPATSEQATPSDSPTTLNDVLENLREAEAFRKKRDEAVQRYDERRQRKLEEVNASLQQENSRLERTLEETEEDLDNANQEVQRLTHQLTARTDLEQTNKKLKQSNAALEDALLKAREELEKAQKELKKRNASQANAATLEETLKKTQQALKDAQRETQAYKKEAQTYKKEAETHKEEKETLMAHVQRDAQSKIDRYRQDLSMYDRVQATPQL